MKILGDSVKEELRPKAMVFMKVGFHVNESLIQIVTRKRLEGNRCGIIFWGYGGATCHPIKQVIPFALEVEYAGISPVVMFSATPSPLEANIVQASELSEDGILWRPLPEGASVTGSRYALICEKLEEIDGFVNLSMYQVAIGPSQGKSLAEYLRFRVDKACAKLIENVDQNRVKARVSYIARLVPPYAVLLS
jgi:hypothetical protein